jgi:hypothetical protein
VVAPGRTQWSFRMACMAGPVSPWAMVCFPTKNREDGRLPIPTNYVEGSALALRVFSSGLSLGSGLATPNISLTGHLVPSIHPMGRCPSPCGSSGFTVLHLLRCSLHLVRHFHLTHFVACFNPPTRPFHFGGGKKKPGFLRLLRTSGLRTEHRQDSLKKPSFWPVPQSELHPSKFCSLTER